MFKREEIEQRKRDHDDKRTLLEQKKTSKLESIHWRTWWATFHELQRREQALEQALEQETQALERETQALEQVTQALEQETQALEMILHWVARGGGQEALKQAEYVLDRCRIKPTDIEQEQHIEQLLAWMEQKYYYSLRPYGLNPHSLGFRQIFNAMREEIPKLIGMHRRLGILNPTLESRFSATLDKILRLSSWTPSSTHNNHLRELLRNALLMLNDLGGNEEYHDYLRDFMKRHTAFCAFTLDNADLITSEDSETTADLCKNLRRLAQNLGKIASTKAEQYQKLYEKFIAHKEALSHWLDSASPGQGKLYF